MDVKSKILRGPDFVAKVAKKSVARLMMDAFQQHDPDQLAMVDLPSKISCTFGDLLRYTLNLASNLHSIVGIHRDDHIAIIAENSHKFFVAALSGLCLAAPIHMVNPGSTTYELEHLLRLTKPRLAFCSKKSLESVKKVQKQLGFLKILIVLDDDVDKSEVLLYSDLIQPPKNNSDFHIDDDIDVDQQVAMIFNSSGTTGLPKGVMLTHENCRYDLIACKEPDIYQTSPGQKVIIVTPFYHIYGFNILKSSLFLGETNLIMDKFDPILYLECIQNYQVQKLHLVPSLANFLAKSPIVEGYNLGSINEVYLTGSPLSVEVALILMDKLHLTNIRQIYGLTELAAGVCITHRQGSSKVGSCGQLMPDRQLKVIDVVTGEVLGPNQRGELCIKGYIMKGYVGDEERTKDIIDSEGFVRTGDVGYYDEDGFVFIVDRLKDLIKYKSFQVAPAELEDIILSHPGVKETAVVGKPDERAGELPMAFVVKRDGQIKLNEADIVDLVAQRVGQEKRLRGGVRFVDDLPKNQVGKVLRRKLREELL